MSQSRLFVAPMERNHWKKHRFLGWLARMERTALSVRHLPCLFSGKLGRPMNWSLVISKSRRDLMIVRCLKLLFETSFIQPNLFYVVLGELGRTLKHVQCINCYVFLSYLSINRILLRPSGQDKDNYNFILAGPNIDFHKISTNSEGFAGVFHSLTKRTVTDILFGDIVWVAKYRLRFCYFFQVTCADNLCHLNKTKHSYGWHPTSRKSVHCRRLAFQYIFSYRWSFHTAWVDAAHCHTPAGGQVCHIFSIGF